MINNPKNVSVSKKHLLKYLVWRNAFSRNNSNTAFWNVTNISMTILKMSWFLKSSKSMRKTSNLTNKNRITCKISRRKLLSFFAEFLRLELRKSWNPKSQSLDKPPRTSQRKERRKKVQNLQSLKNSAKWILNIYLQKSASIQPRTSSPQFGSVTN